MINSRVCVWRPALCRFIRSAFAAALTLLAGCAVGPDYVRPKSEVPAAYKEMQGWKVAQPRDAIARGAWWEVFGDPKLNALEEQVSVSNQNIAAAEAQFQQARAAIRAAQAGYFPTVTVGGSYTRARSSSTQGRGTGSTSGTTSDFLLPLDLSWEIDLWGRIRRTVEASKATAEASAADVATIRLSMQATLAQDYFLLRALDTDKQLLDATVDAYSKSLQMVKNRYASGVASKAEVFQAETLLKTTQAQALDVGVQRAQLEHAIGTLVGKPASNFSIAFSPLDVAVPVIPVSVPSELLERRPDIAAAERLVAAANAQIGVADAAFYPTVSLTAVGGFQSSSLSQWLTWPSRFWSMGPGIAETVFDGGLRKAQSDEARATYSANVASYRQTVLNGFQEVEDSLATLRILEQESMVQDAAVKAAQQSLAFSMNQYKAGTISYIDVVVIQTIALNNEKAAIDILGRRLFASVALIKALGGGWETSDLLLGNNMLDDQDRQKDHSP